MEEIRENQEVVTDDVYEPETVVCEVEDDSPQDSRSAVPGFLAGVAVGAGITTGIRWVIGKVKNAGTKTRKAVVRKILEKEGIEVPEDYQEVKSDEEPEKKSEKKSEKK